MLYTDYTEELLGLKDVIVTKVENVEGSVHIYLEIKLETQVCPHCRHETKRTHDYRTQIVKDSAIFGTAVYLHIHKRRYYCPHCGKSFNQKISFLPKYQRITTRKQAQIMDEFRKVCSIKSVAERHNVSQTAAARLLDYISYPKPSLPEVLSIDEFKGNAGGHKFQCILTNPKKKQVLFPNAQVVANKFHVCIQVTWALERVRKEEQKKFGKDRRIYFKKSRWILLKHNEDLTQDERIQLEGMLQVSTNIRDAYMLKEKFYSFMASKDIHQARSRLKEWFLLVGSVDLQDFKSCVGTFSRWDKEILAAFDCGFSNGFTEGTNNKIKVIKRISFGVKNFKRFRNRILHATAA